MKNFRIGLVALSISGLASGGAFSQSTEVTGALIGPVSAPHKIAEAGSFKPPMGNRAAWDDDRLNPYTGVGTPAGKAKMEMVWSKTVPRYLIDPATGKRLR